MTASVDPLLMAILAMNAYSTQSDGNSIGDAEVIDTSASLTDSNGQRLDLPAGFYAVAYLLPNDSIVISYRGTYSPAVLADIVNGWGVGAGDPYAPQAQLAIQFYQQVEQAYPDSTISVTGHSLGGGLAGFVGSLFGLSGVLFDSMDYAAAVNQLYQDTLTDAAGVQTDATIVAEMQALSQAVYGEGAPWAPNGSGLSAYAVNGEILSSGLLGLAGIGVGAEGSGSVLDPGGDVTQTPLVNAYDLHSAALLVSLLYASQEGLSEWLDMGVDSSGDSPFLQALFNNALASAVGVSSASQMLTEIAYSAIAYSALDPAGALPGGLPYGDTALPGLFADADYLGNAVAAGEIGGGAPTNGSVSALAGGDVLDALCDILVQYAGDQAATAGQDAGNDPTANANGDFAASTNITLSIDLNPAEDDFDEVTGTVFDPTNPTDVQLLAQDIANGTIAGGALVSSIGADGDLTALEQRIVSDDDTITNITTNADGDTTFTDSYGDQIVLNPNREEVSESTSDGQGGTITQTFGYSSNGTQYVATEQDVSGSGQLLSSVVDTVDPTSGALLSSSETDYNNSGAEIDSFTTNANGDITTYDQYNPDGSQDFYVYNSAGEATSDTQYSADGAVVQSQQFAYDSSGDLAEIDTTSGAGVLVSTDVYQPDGSDVLTTFNSDGSQTVDAFNSSGLETSDTQYSSSGAIVDTQSFAYDSSDNLASITTDDGSGSLLSLDAYNPDGSHTLTDYNSSGQPDEETQYASDGVTVELVETLAYDSSGDLASVTTYDGSGDLLSEIDYGPTTDASGAPEEASSLSVTAASGETFVYDAGQIASQLGSTIGNLLAQNGSVFDKIAADTLSGDLGATLQQALAGSGDFSTSLVAAGADGQSELDGAVDDALWSAVQRHAFVRHAPRDARGASPS